MHICICVHNAHLEPAKDVAGAAQQLGALAGVVEQLGPRDEGRLADEAKDGEGGDRALTDRQGMGYIYHIYVYECVHESAYMQ